MAITRIFAPRWAAALCGSLAVTLGAFSAGAQDARDMLTASIETTLVEEGLVGVTWALVTPEGTTIGAAGLNDASRQRTMSPSDRVQVGSVAKTLVATGVLRLVTLGRVDLDAPLRVRAGVGTLRARLELGAIAGLLQWYAVLAAWGLAPLVLWR